MSIAAIRPGEDSIDDKLTELIAGHNAVVAGTTPIALPGIAGALGEYEPLQNMRDGVANVFDFPGVVGDGVNDDSDGIQAAFESGASIVDFPQPPVRYVALDLEPQRGQLLRAKSGFRYPYSATNVPVQLYNNTNMPTIHVDNPGIQIEGFVFRGSNSAVQPLNSAVVGAGDYTTIENCSFYQFGGPAIHSESGSNAWAIRRILTSACVMGYPSLSDYVGAVDLDGSDHWVADSELGAQGLGYSGGYSAACVIRGGSPMLTQVVGELSEVGFVLMPNSSGGSFVGCRADNNLGHGWLIDGGFHSFSSCKAGQNGTSANNTFDHFNNTSWNSMFVGCLAYQPGVANKARYGFYDWSDGSAGNKSLYIGCTTRGTMGTAPHAMTTGSVYVDLSIANATYSASNVTTDRAFDANSTTTDELADVLGTLIADLRAKGLVL